jgi:hypothetical protein
MSSKFKNGPRLSDRQKESQEAILAELGLPGVFRVKWTGTCRVSGTSIYPGDMVVPWDESLIEEKPNAGLAHFGAAWKYALRGEVIKTKEGVAAADREATAWLLSEMLDRAALGRAKRMFTCDECWTTKPIEERRGQLCASCSEATQKETGDEEA